VSTISPPRLLSVSRRDVAAKIIILPEMNYLCVRLKRKSMIKAVVFDMGGVLLKLNIERCVRKFKEDAGFKDIEYYLDSYHQKGFIGDFEEGRINEEEFYAECLKHCAPGSTMETVLNCFVGLLAGLNDEMIDFIRSIRGKYDLYLLTNNNPISRREFDGLMDKTGLPSSIVFKKQFYSYELHMQKPSREIFIKVIDEIGCKPEEMLFIDDGKKNIDAASAFGIKTVQYVPGVDLISALNQ